MIVTIVIGGLNKINLIENKINLIEAANVFSVLIK